MLGFACGSPISCVAVGSTLVESNNFVDPGRGEAEWTNDGGRRWEGARFQVALGGLGDGISCWSATSCLTQDWQSPGGNLTLATSSGGTTWTGRLLPRDDSIPGALTCPAPRLCISVGQHVLSSASGGVTWTEDIVPGGFHLRGVLDAASCPVRASASPSVADPTVIRRRSRLSRRLPEGHGRPYTCRRGCPTCTGSPALPKTLARHSGGREAQRC